MASQVFSIAASALLLSTALAAPTTTGSNVKIIDNEADLNALLSTGLLQTNCQQPCLTDIILATRELLNFKDTIKQYGNLCRTYENAFMCIAETEQICTANGNYSFAQSTDLVDQMCNVKTHLFEEQSSCVESHVDTVLEECNTSCKFTTSIAQTASRDAVRELAASGGNRAELIKEMDELCPSTSCFVSCISTKFDRVCPTAGYSIASVLMRPFMVEAEYIEKDEHFRAVIMQLLPPTCIPLAVRETIEAIIAGDFFTEQTQENVAILTAAETLKESPSEQSIEAQLEGDGSMGENRGDLEMATIMEAAELEGSGSGSGSGSGWIVAEEEDYMAVLSTDI